MGNVVSTDVDYITDISVPNHIQYKVWNSCSYVNSEGVCIGGWDYYSTSSRLHGNVRGDTNSVFIHGRKAVTKGSQSNESDDYTLPSGGVYESGQHLYINGTVSEGNDANVFYEGRSVAIRGSMVTTHTGQKTPIYDTRTQNVYAGILTNGLVEPPKPEPPVVPPKPPYVPPDVEGGGGANGSITTSCQTRSWRDKSGWGWRDANDGSSPEEQYYLYQGEWCESNGTCWGNHKGIISFSTSILKSCRGKKIKKVEVYLDRNDRNGYPEKQGLYIYSHNYNAVFPEPATGKPNKEPSIGNYGGILLGNDGTGWGTGEAKWATLPSKYNALLSNGSIKGIAFHRTDRKGYMHFDGRKIKIKVTFS